MVMEMVKIVTLTVLTRSTSDTKVIKGRMTAANTSLVGSTGYTRCSVVLSHRVQSLMRMGRFAC